MTKLEELGILQERLFFLATIKVTNGMPMQQENLDKRRAELFARIEQIRQDISGE